MPSRHQKESVLMHTTLSNHGRLVHDVEMPPAMGSHPSSYRSTGSAKYKTERSPHHKTSFKEKLAKFGQKLDKGFKGLGRDIKTGVHDVEKVGSGLVHTVDRVGNDVLNAGEGVLKGVGGLGNVIEYVPFLLVGLIGLAIFKSKDIGTAIGAARGV
jgi:uncharacterized FlaG/YvyC family protein